MWSLDAGAMEFPERVSLSVGGNTSIQHLVLQVSIIIIMIILTMILMPGSLHQHREHSRLG